MIPISNKQSKAFKEGLKKDNQHQVGEDKVGIANRKDNLAHEKSPTSGAGMICENCGHRKYNHNKFYNSCKKFKPKQEEKRTKRWKW